MTGSCQQTAVMFMSLRWHYCLDEKKGGGGEPGAKCWMSVAGRRESSDWRKPKALLGLE